MRHLWGVFNAADGTDLGTYEASSKVEALAAFLDDTDDLELDPHVTAEQWAEDR